MTGRWYISVTAAQEYADLAGWPAGEDSLARATAALVQLADSAIRTDRVQRSGLRIYRSTGKVDLPDGRRTRLEYAVDESARPEGPLMALVHVQARDLR